MVKALVGLMAEGEAALLVASKVAASVVYLAVS